MAKRVDFQVIGTTGLKRTSGIIREEYLRELQGARGRAIYAEMANQDAVIGGVLFAIEMFLRGMDWEMVPASQDPVDVDNRDFVDGCLNDMETVWKELLSEILTFLPFGWSLFEVLFKLRQGPGDDPTRSSKYDDGLIGWRDWSIRAQDTLLLWDFDDEGNVTAMRQLAEPDFRERVIPLDKALLFRTTVHKGNPEGISVLRRCYRDWYFKRHLESIEGIGAERDLAGLPMMRVPAEIMRTDANAEDQATLAYCKTLVTNIRRDEQEGLVLPAEYDPATGKPLYELTLLSTGGTRQFDLDKVITRKDHRMAGALLADWMMLGQQAVGSFALASSKTEMFALAIGAWADAICSIVNRRAIPKLLELNGKPVVAGPPTLRHGDIESVDLKDLANYVTSLAGAGAPLTPEMFAHLYRQAGLPVPEETVS